MRNAARRRAHRVAVQRFSHWHGSCDAVSSRSGCSHGYPSMETTRSVIPVDAGAAAASAVSWGAILAGAAAACALSLILVFLGLGFGMSAISPWAGSGASATALSVGAIAWITLTQIVAAAIGGYLAGRLRVRWTVANRDEVYFRDTAHGFVAWAVATLAVAACFTSTLGAVAKTGAELGGDAMHAAATGAAAAMPRDARPRDGGPRNDALDYTVDVLLRRSGTSEPAAAPVDATTGMPAPDASAGNDDRGIDVRRGEVARIYGRALTTGTLADADVRYLGQVVAQRSGLAPAEAEARVRQAYADLQAAAQAAKVAADEARKAAAYTSLWLFIALLAGAFVASFAATYGGRQRDYDAPVR